jgi:hypothetical protein
MVAKRGAWRVAKFRARRAARHIARVTAKITVRSIVSPLARITAKCTVRAAGNANRTARHMRNTIVTITVKITGRCRDLCRVVYGEEMSVL